MVFVLAPAQIDAPIMSVAGQYQVDLGRHALVLRQPRVGIALGPRLLD